MVLEFLVACGLVLVTVAMHSAGFAILLRALLHRRGLVGFWPVSRLVIGLTCWLLLIHLSEIALWGGFYYWRGCLPDLEAAFYFSGVTYTTVGYGDVVLSGPWRTIAPIEALTGILMCGLSTGLFFALATRLTAVWFKAKVSEEHNPDGF